VKCYILVNSIVTRYIEFIIYKEVLKFFMKILNFLDKTFIKLILDIFKK